MRFDTWITINNLNDVRFFHLSYLITLLATCAHKWPNQLFYVWLVDLQTICAKYVLETWLSLQIIIFEFVSSTWSIFELKTHFETWIKWNDLNGVRLFPLSYLITLMAYLCAQRTPNIQIKYFMLDWSIYRIFVINRGWKRDSLQIMIFAYICSTWDIDEIRTRLRR
jgi:hypothetical protein